MLQEVGRKEGERKKEEGEGEKKVVLNYFLQCNNKRKGKKLWTFSK